jgi:heat shock protein HslJ
MPKSFKMRYYPFLLLIITVMYSCNKSENCIAVTNRDCVTTLEFAPVCGCDGITYGNSSAARCAQVDFTQGVCDQNIEKLVGDWKFLGFDSADKFNGAYTAKKHSYDMNMKIVLAKDVFSFGGRSSVNNYGGSFTVEFNNMGLRQIIVNQAIWSTEIAGTLEANQYESKYYEALVSMSNYKINGDLLFIAFFTAKESDRLVYKKIR